MEGREGSRLCGMASGVGMFGVGVCGVGGETGSGAQHLWHRVRLCLHGHFPGFGYVYMETSKVGHFPVYPRFK